MTKMSRLNQRIDTLLSVVAVVVLIAAVVHIVAHALMRAFLNAPIYGTNEIVAFWYLPLIVLLGIPAAQLRGEHINVTLVTERVSKRARSLLHRLASLLSLVLSVGFAWFGLIEAIDKYQVSATAGVTSITTWPVYFIVVLAFSTLAYLNLLMLMRPDRDLLPRGREFS